MSSGGTKSSSAAALSVFPAAVGAFLASTTSLSGFSATSVA